MSDSKKTYSKETMEDVSVLLGYGFNSREISERLDLHHATVRQVKLNLKQLFRDEHENESDDKECGGGSCGGHQGEGGEDEEE